MAQLGRFTSDTAREKYERAYRALEALWPLPATDLEVPTTFGTSYVRRSGSGEGIPVVLLHGLNGNGLSWHAVVAELAEDRVVYAPDVVGTAGRSVQSAPLTRPSDYGAWGAELLDGLGLERAHILGYSEGARFAALLAARSPLRIASLTLGEGITALVKPSKAVLARMVRAAMWPTRRCLERLDAWLTPGVTLTDADRDCARAAMAYRRRTPWASPLSDAELAAITAPTLAVFGAETRLGDPHAAAERITANVPDAQVEVVPGGGHGVLLQLPDQVVPRITTFWRAHDVG
jgi:pimeloyl-ACP methyl ester carboxylesterase